MAVAGFVAALAVAKAEGVELAAEVETAGQVDSDQAGRTPVGCSVACV